MPTTTPFNNLITFSRGSNATVTGSNGLIQWAPNNLLTFSEQFDNAAWTKAAGSVVANNAVAPDGTATADKLLDNAAFTEHGVWASMAVSNNVLSVYAKAAELSVIYFRFRQSSGQALSVAFDLANGTVCKTTNQGTYYTSGVGSIQAVGNGWYRCSVYVACAPLTANVFISLSDTNNPTFAANGDYSYTGTGTSGVLLWGAQLELGSTATTYNPTTVKNLLGFSEAFDNAAWSKSGTSIVTGAHANPVNGLFNAQKLMENTASGEHRTFFTIITAPSTYTYSVYLKAAERTFASLIHLTVSPQPSIVVNLTTGAITSPTNVTASGAVNVGNGWWRVWMTYTTTTSTTSYPQVMVFSNATTGNYVGDGNSGVYIYGAQLSDSASLDPYVPTPGAAPSSTAFYGPRFDFDPVTLQPRGLLVEEQRTNLLLRSEDFTTTWAASGATVAANTTTGPSGAIDADTLTEDTSAAANHRTSQTISVTSGTTYTFSAFVKRNGRNFVQLFFSSADFGLNAWANFDLNAGVVGDKGSAATSTITAFGNGWYRCTVTAPATATNASAIALIQMVTSATAVRSETYNGNGTSGIFLYGAQLEAGAFATSYIPTLASTVTRSADVATITGQNFAQWYGQTEGSFITSASCNASGNVFIFSADDNTANNSIAARGSGVDPRFAVTTAGVTQVDIDAGTISASTPFVLAGAYKVNDFAASVNGGASVLDTSGTIPTVDRLRIGAAQFGLPLNGHIRAIRFIPARAADFQLQALST